MDGWGAEFGEDRFPEEASEVILSIYDRYQHLLVDRESITTWFGADCYPPFFTKPVLRCPKFIGKEEDKTECFRRNVLKCRLRVNEVLPDAIRNEEQIRKVVADIVKSIPTTLYSGFENKDVFFKRVGPSEMSHFREIKKSISRTIFEKRNTTSGMLKINFPEMQERNAMFLSSTAANVIIIEKEQDEVDLPLIEKWKLVTALNELETQCFKIDVPEKEFSMQINDGQSLKLIEGCEKKLEDTRELLSCKVMYNLRNDLHRYAVAVINNPEECRRARTIFLDLGMLIYPLDINDRNDQTKFHIQNFPAHIRTNDDLTWFLRRLLGKNNVTLKKAYFKRETRRQVFISPKKAKEKTEKLLQYCYRMLGLYGQVSQEEKDTVHIVESEQKDELSLQFDEARFGMEVMKYVMQSRARYLTRVQYGDYQHSGIDFMPSYKKLLKVKRSIRIAANDQIIEFDKLIRKTSVNEIGYDKPVYLRIIDVFDEKSDIVEIGIEGWTERLVNDQFEQLKKILEPKLIDCANSNSELLFGVGEAYVNHVVRSFKGFRAIVDIDRCNKKIKVYGSCAEMAIAEILKFNEIKSKLEINTVISIESPFFNKQLWNCLTWSNINAIRSATNSEITLDNNFKLWFAGSFAALEDVHFILKEVNDKIFEKLCQSIGIANSVATDSKCPICSKDVASNFYRLEKCGHMYCKTCLHDLIENSIDNHSFPCKCVHSNCGDTILPVDFERLILGDRDQFNTVDSRIWQRLLDIILVSSNGSFRMCPTEDCVAFLTKSENPRRRRKRCNRCDVEYCAHCLMTDHFGYCKEFGRVRSELNAIRETYGLDLSEYGRLRICPKWNCRTVIQKLSGCNHMRCTRCQTNFCWLCGWSTSEENIIQHMCEHGSDYEDD